MLAVGSDDPNTNAGGKVQIHEYNEASRSVLCLKIENKCSQEMTKSIKVLFMVTDLYILLLK